MYMYVVQEMQEFSFYTAAFIYVYVYNKLNRRMPLSWYVFLMLKRCLLLHTGFSWKWIFIGCIEIRFSKVYAATFKNEIIPLKSVHYASI